MITRLLALLAFGAAFACTVALIGAPAPNVTGTASICQRLVTDYMALRHSIVEDVHRLRDETKADPVFSEAVASALQAARRNARPGDLLCPNSVNRLVTAVRMDLWRRDPLDRRAVLSEVRPASSVRVNDLYPADAPLPTMPPLLLRQLEPLPDGLQYSFLGDALVLLDVDTRVIVDVVPHVIHGTT